MKLLILMVLIVLKNFLFSDSFGCKSSEILYPSS